jgi:hypothetical protein
MFKSKALEMYPNGQFWYVNTYTIWQPWKEVERVASMLFAILGRSRDRLYKPVSAAVT